MDPQARFEALYRRHADRVHAYAARRSTHAVADDVVSEVFLVAWRRLDHVPDEPLPWLLGVARGVLANRRRAEGRAAALHDRLAGTTRSFTPPPALRGDHLAGALARLGDRDRELLLLVAWEGLTHAEVAAALGIRPGTVAVRLHRARERFARALAAQDGTAQDGTAQDGTAQDGNAQDGNAQDNAQANNAQADNAQPVEVPR